MKLAHTLKPYLDSKIAELQKISVNVLIELEYKNQKYFLKIIYDLKIVMRLMFYIVII